MPMHPLSVVAIGIVTVAAVVAGMELFKEQSRGRFGYEDEDSFAYRCYQEEKEEFCRVEKEEKERIQVSKAREESVGKLLAMGFEIGHIEEAVKCTSSFEEALEYLLVTASTKQGQNNSPEKLVDHVQKLSLSEIQSEREAIKKRLEELEEIERKEMFSHDSGNSMALIDLDSTPAVRPLEHPTQSVHLEHLVEQAFDKKSSNSSYHPVQFEEPHFEEPSFEENPVFESITSNAPDYELEKSASVGFASTRSVTESVPSIVSYTASSVKSEASAPSEVESIPSLNSGELSSVQSCLSPAVPPVMEENEIMMESVPVTSRSICTVYHEAIDEDSSAIDNVQFAVSENAVSIVNPSNSDPQSLPDKVALYDQHEDEKSFNSFKSIPLAQDTIRLMHEIDVEESEDSLSQTSVSAPSEGWDVVSNQ